MFWTFTGNCVCAVGNKRCHRLCVDRKKRCHRMWAVSRKQCRLKIALSTTLWKRCLVGFLVPVWFQNLAFAFQFLCVFVLPFDENENEGPWIVYSVVALIVIFFLHSKRVYVSCIGVYILFFSWNLLLLFVDIIRWNWKIYISFSWVGFGLFCTWNAWVINVVLILSLLRVILVSFCMLIFSVLGRKDRFFVSLSVQREVLVFKEKF